MAKHKTRKDRYSQDAKEGRFFWRRPGMYKDLKKLTARRNRRRPVTDETPYKRLDDPWKYD